MANPDLSESAWARAVAESARIYPSIGFGVTASLTTIIFGSIAAVVSVGENATSQIAYPIIGGALALGLTFAVVFVLQLSAAPVRQRNELRAAWEAPAEVETVNVPLSLRNLRRKGIELLHRYRGTGIGRREELALEEWADSVINFMGKHLAPAETQAFIQAGEAERGALNRLDARITTLQQLIGGDD